MSPGYVVETDGEIAYYQYESDAKDAFAAALALGKQSQVLIVARIVRTVDMGIWRMDKSTLKTLVATVAQQVKDDT